VYIHSERGRDDVSSPNILLSHSRPSLLDHKEKSRIRMREDVRRE